MTARYQSPTHHNTYQSKNQMLTQSSALSFVVENCHFLPLSVPKLSHGILCNPLRLHHLQTEYNHSTFRTTLQIFVVICEDEGTQRKTANMLWRTLTHVSSVKAWSNLGTSVPDSIIMVRLSMSITSLPGSVPGGGEQYFDAPVYKQLETIAQHGEQIQETVCFHLAEYHMALDEPAQAD
jgi:hypothetical protein